MDEHSIIEVQTKLAYMEDAVQTLNEVVTRQQGQIDRLTAKVTELIEHLKKFDDPAGNAPNDGRPPHY